MFFVWNIGQSFKILTFIKTCTSYFMGWRDYYFLTTVATHGHIPILHVFNSQMGVTVIPQRDAPFHHTPSLCVCVYIYIYIYIYIYEHQQSLSPKSRFHCFTTRYQHVLARTEGEEKKCSLFWRRSEAPTSKSTSLAMFMMSFFEVPKWVLEKIDYFRSRFF
jgi:hypothetical protein